MVTKESGFNLSETAYHAEYDVFYARLTWQGMVKL